MLSSRDHPFILPPCHPPSLITAPWTLNLRFVGSCRDSSLFFLRIPCSRETTKRHSPSSLTLREPLRPTTGDSSRLAVQSSTTQSNAFPPTSPVWCLCRSVVQSRHDVPYRPTVAQDHSCLRARLELKIAASPSASPSFTSLWPFQASPTCSALPAQASPGRSSREREPSTQRCAPSLARFQLPVRTSLIPRLNTDLLRGKNEQQSYHGLIWFP